MARRLLVISRPIVWLPTVGIYYLGVLMGPHTTWTWAVVLGLAFFTLPVGIIVYGLNDIADRESDAQNTRKGSVNGAVVTQNEIGFIVAAAVSTTFIFSVAFALGGHYFAALGVVLLLGISYLYSTPPFHYKGRPILDLVAVGLTVLAAYLTGFLVNEAGFSLAYLPSWHVLFTLFCCAAAVDIILEVVDYDVDKRIGDKTTAVLVGKRAAMLLGAALFVVCFASVSGRVPSIYFLYCAVLTLGASFMIRRKILLGLAAATAAPVPFLVVFIALRGM